MAAVYQNEFMALPVTYDFPACDSTEYASLLACPRAPQLCPGKGNESSPASDEIGDLGMLTSHAQIGRKAFVGIVGVSCEGNLVTDSCTCTVVFPC